MVCNFRSDETDVRLADTVGDITLEQWHLTLSGEVVLFHVTKFKASCTLELFQLYIERNFCARDRDLRIRYIPENVKFNPHIAGNDILQNSMLSAVSYMHGVQLKQQAVDDINQARHREEQIRNICTSHWEDTKAKRSKKKKPKRTRREAQAWHMLEEAIKEPESVPKLQKLFGVYQKMLEFKIIVFYKGARKGRSFAKLVLHTTRNSAVCLKSREW